MNKTELEAKVDGLTDEINFLRALYEAVSKLYCRFPQSGTIQVCWFTTPSQQDAYQEDTRLRKNVCAITVFSSGTDLLTEDKLSDPCKESI